MDGAALDGSEVAGFCLDVKSFNAGQGDNPSISVKIHENDGMTV